MITLSCRETGFECDYIAEGNTKDQILKDISKHAISVHGMRAEDIYENNVSTAFLCQAIGKITSIGDQQS